MNPSNIEKHIRTIPDFPKPGIQFKDITPLLTQPKETEEVLSMFEEQWKDAGIDVLVGIESRGFLFGMALAQRLNIPFVPVRKAGKLPGQIYQFSYDLEYGSSILEIHKDAFKEGSNVLIHDDLLATGGTAKAAAELCKKLGAKVSGFSFLISLDGLGGEKKLLKYTKDIKTILKY